MDRQHIFFTAFAVDAAFWCRSMSGCFDAFLLVCAASPPLLLQTLMSWTSVWVE
jgi:hypothetical protein